MDRQAIPIVHVCLLAFLVCITLSRVQGSENALDKIFTDYADILRAHVDNQGMVSYKDLSADPGKLDAFAQQLATLDRPTFDKWNDSERIAFWINAYNGLTLKAIIDNYPIEASWTVSLRFPNNSIRQIPGVWNRLKFSIMGRAMTLDEIEHGILRNEFDEPRIHMALVCAAMGCPPLRNEPYIGSILDQQLDDQAKRFLSNQAKFSIDHERQIVYLSSIFKWFRKDFAKTYGGDERFSNYGASERAVLSFISRYIGESNSTLLAGETIYRINYLDYDWSLNEQ